MDFWKEHILILVTFSIYRITRVSWVLVNSMSKLILRIRKVADSKIINYLSIQIMLVNCLFKKSK